MIAIDVQRDRREATAEGASLWALLREDVRCVKSRNPAARHVIEIILTYPGVHAIIAHRLAHRLWRCGMCFPARFLSWFARLTTNVDIHPGATIGRGFSSIMAPAS